MERSRGDAAAANCYAVERSRGDAAAANCYAVERSRGDAAAPTRNVRRDRFRRYTQDKAKYEKTVRDHVKSLKK